MSGPGFGIGFVGGRAALRSKYLKSVTQNNLESVARVNGSGVIVR
jgi:hypothetical protein